MKRSARWAVVGLMCAAGSVWAAPRNIMGTGAFLVRPPVMNQWEANAATVSAGLGYSSATLALDAAGNYCFNNSMQAAAAVAYLNHDDDWVGSGPAFQAAFGYRLPFQLPFNLETGVRGRLFGFLGDTDVFGTALEALVSWQCLWVKNLYASAAVGPALGFFDDGNDSDSEVKPVIATSATYAINGQLSAFAGTTYGGQYWTFETGIGYSFP